MKKRLSHFAYNERSRSGWTLGIPPVYIFESTPIDHKKLLPMSPARLLPLSPVRTAVEAVVVADGRLEGSGFSSAPHEAVNGLQMSTRTSSRFTTRLRIRTTMQKDKR